MNRKQQIANGINVAKQHHTDIFNIINKLYGSKFTYEDATNEEDMTECSDFWIKKDGKRAQVSIRLRDAGLGFRDFTIRKTEFIKIKQGKGRLYFYGWLDNQNNIIEYVIIDLCKFRNYINNNANSGLIKNKDGITSFYHYDLLDLDRYKAIILYKKVVCGWVDMKNNGYEWKPQTCNDFFMFD